MDRRNFGRGLVAAGVAMALPHPALARRAFGGRLGTANPIPQYYVSPTGDDNNPGTLASPWSITFLNNNQATYPGKVIGFLPGTYQYGTKGGVQTTIYSKMTTNGNDIEVLSLQGGPSAASPTYLCACDSSGNYLLRTATTTAAELPIIDCRDPSTGNQPILSGTQVVPLFGQIYGHAAPNVSQYGNVTIDGLVMRYWATNAFMSLGHVSGGYYSDHIIIKNCEIYGSFGNAEGNNNPAAIWCQTAGYDNPAYGMQVINCLIYDLQTSNPSQGPMCGVYATNQTFGTVVKNNTFYNSIGPSFKDGLAGGEVSYNYIGWFGTLGADYYSGAQSTNPLGTVRNYLTGSGLTVDFHHNIVCGLMYSYGESHQANQGTVNFYNNTFYKPGGVGGSNLGLLLWTDYDATASGGIGSFNWWNNLTYAADANYASAPGAFVKMGASTGGTRSTLSSDHNAYGIGMTFGDNSTVWNLASFQGLGHGYEASSISLSSNPFSGTPTEPRTDATDYTTFAVSSSSPAYTAGRSGAICGAVDGSGAIGCNFTAAV
jgi:hypothetical protein